jgi:hypothetical protein
MNAREKIIIKFIPIHPRGQNGCKEKKDNAFFHSSFSIWKCGVVPKEKTPTSIK